MAFPTTLWTELAAASLHGDTRAQSALDNLCRRYYRPVREFVLRRGYGESEADDLTQDFFRRFLADRSWKRASPQRGSFRNFLLGAVTHLLGDAERFRRRQRRGGGVEPLSLDHPAADESAQLSPVLPAPATYFDRAWAIQVLEDALEQVRAEYREAGKIEQYQQLKAFLPGGEVAPSYEDAARALALTVPGLKTQIHRLRQAFRRALRAQVAGTVSAPHEIDGELRHLQAALIEEAAEERAAKLPLGNGE